MHQTMYMDTLNSNEQVQKAYQFASNKHCGQKRSTGLPYITHCINTCNIVSQIKASNFDTIFAQIVAILHDTIEDTDATYQEINEIFGKEIADGVLALTKNEELPRQERMDDCLERIKKCGAEVAAVKMSDRIDNISQLNPIWDKERSIQYMKEAIHISDIIGDCCPQMNKKLKEQIIEYSKMIQNINKGEKYDLFKTT